MAGRFCCCLSKIHPKTENSAAKMAGKNSPADQKFTLKIHRIGLKRGRKVAGAVKYFLALT